MPRSKTPPWRPLWLILSTSLWLAALGNLPLWQTLHDMGLFIGTKGLVFAGAMLLVLTGALLALQSLLAWRWLLKGGVTLLLLVTALGAHYMQTYRVVIDPTMVVNVLQTNPGEAADLLSPQLLWTLVWLAGLPAWLVWRTPLHYGAWPRRALGNLGLLLLGLVVAVAALVVGFQPISSTMRNHKQLRYLINPLNTVYALGHVATAPLRLADKRLQALGEDAQRQPGAAAGGKPPLLLLVLGETARAASFGVLGYGRDTTPALARQADLVAQTASSCGTSTAASLPCMFAHLGREAYDNRQASYENLLDVLQRAGLAVLWLDNQAGCKGLCDRVANATTADAPPPGLCSGGECLDEALLVGLDQRIAALPAERRARGVVLVLHQMGSHGPAYFKRSPPAFKRFMPECTSAALQDCPREQVLNAYENTIAYTDQVLAKSIAWLQGRSAEFDTAMLYVSDHGESLGEAGLYLHGLPYALAPEVQTRVPWLAWFSPAWRERQGLDLACLRQPVPGLSHDHYFHSVLGLMDVATQVRQPALDAYAACRKP